MAPEGRPPEIAALEARVTQLEAEITELEAQVSRLTEALTQLRRDLGQRLAYTHGQDLLDTGGEFRRLTCTHPQAVACYWPGCRNSRRIIPFAV